MSANAQGNVSGGLAIVDQWLSGAGMKRSGTLVMILVFVVLCIAMGAAFVLLLMKSARERQPCRLDDQELPRGSLPVEERPCPL
jgi:hypothetical protein